MTRRTRLNDATADKELYSKPDKMDSRKVLSYLEHPDSVQGKPLVDKLHQTQTTIQADENWVILALGH